MNSMAMDTSLYFTQRNKQNVPVVLQEISNLMDEPKQVAILKIWYGDHGPRSMSSSNIDYSIKTFFNVYLIV